MERLLRNCARSRTIREDAAMRVPNDSPIVRNHRREIPRIGSRGGHATQLIRF